MKKMMVTMLSMFAEFERDIISQRTKEALKGLKDSGVTLGKPKGTLQKTQYDKDNDRIIELLNLGLSYKKIIDKHLGYGSVSTLHTYIKKRDLLVA
jgi:DNA invertase Pin-like site-specific DNA recombinase